MQFSLRLPLLRLTASAALATLLATHPAPADACGCFTPPDPSVPIVQAGENILFAMKDGQVTSHIQVQYRGPAEEFGWLLPLPSVPTLELGTDELFLQLIATTQPKYRLNREYDGTCPFNPSGPYAPTADSSGGGAEGGNGVVVVQDTIGPYDYAVLKADSQKPMLDWLAANHFFVPTTTAASVIPYIHQGAYFLALKLHKGNDVGDLQPVVVKYASDLPMIPIVLTSVAADPDMGIQVWMLGDHRAIPRNYYHTVINDAVVDWLNAGANYVDVVTRAVDDAPGHHSFVTEYAGTSGIMANVLDYQGRFGDTAQLAKLTRAADYLNFLYNNGFGVYSSNGFGPPVLTSQVISILSRYLPVPAKLATAEGLTPASYYQSIDYWVQHYGQAYPTEAAAAPADLTFDPVAMTAELDERIIKPTLAAGALFTAQPYLTRLFTTLSPDEMNRDPVFSYNADLGDVSNVHEARLIYYCADGSNPDQTTTPATLVTESGWVLNFPHGTVENPWLDAKLPASQRTEVLREEGPPVVYADNHDTISGRTDRLDDGGCAISTSAQTKGAASAFVAGLVGLALLASRLLRRRDGAR